MERIFEPKEFFPEYESEEERRRLPYLENIALLLEMGKKEYADQRAIVAGERVLTYAQLYDDVSHRRALLTEKRIPAGAHIGLTCTDPLEARCWLLAVTTSGRVAVILLPAAQEEKLKSMARKFKLAALIADGAAGEDVRGIVPCVIAESDASGNAEGAALLTKETPAAIFFTGGSTGTPKGALLSHGAIMRGALNGTSFRAGFVFGNSTISFLPLYHVFGAIAGFFACLYTGTEIHVFPDIPTGIAGIPVVRPTMLVLVPGLVSILLTMAGLKGAGFMGNLKSIVCGGAPVPQKLITEMLGYGVRIYPGYGLTEAANFSCANLNAENVPDSVGRLYPPQQMKLVDGELWLKGDNIMLGYYGDEEETSLVMEDGWLKTGDLASIDEEGYITIIGRKKNVIILSNGENIYPEEIEKMINASELVKDCLVKEMTVNGARLLGVEVYPDKTRLKSVDPSLIGIKIIQVVEEVNQRLLPHEQLMHIIVREEDFKRMPSLKIDRIHS